MQKLGPAGTRALLVASLLILSVAASLNGVAQQAGEVDTALVVSVDVSNSVDESRYKLQMEGIAQALEDKDVLDAILNGPQGGILFSMVTWADKPQIAIPWKKISSKEEAAEVAALVRRLPRQTGEFTCV